MKKNKQSVQIGLGASSILMIFVVLCMMILSVLAYNHAQQNEAITRREVAYEEAYLEANTNACMVYEGISNMATQTNEMNDIIIQSTMQDMLLKSNVTYRVDEATLYASFYINKTQTLQVVLEKQGLDIMKKEWKLESTGGSSS